MTTPPRRTRTDKQIDQFRKGTARIEVTDRAGRPCAGLNLSIEQTAHAFVFGCVADRRRPSERDRYRRRLREVFNRVWQTGEALELGRPALDLRQARQRVRLGTLRRDLDRLGACGDRLVVQIAGPTVGAEEEPAAECTDGEFACRVIELYTLLFSHPVVAAIVWHDLVADEPAEAGVPTHGLLTARLAPKRAHTMLRKLIRTVWHTRTAGETDSAGRFEFCGFYGTYHVAIGQPLAQTVTIQLAREMPIVIPNVSTPS